jgi:hypothetical protein
VACAGASVPRSAALGDADLATRPSSTVSLRVSRLCLPHSSSSLPLPIHWWRVEDEAESVCS